MFNFKKLKFCSLAILFFTLGSPYAADFGDLLIENLTSNSIHVYTTNWNGSSPCTRIKSNEKIPIASWESETVRVGEKPVSCFVKLKEVDGKQCKFLVTFSTQVAARKETCDTGIHGLGASTHLGGLVRICSKESNCTK